MSKLSKKSMELKPITDALSNVAILSFVNDQKGIDEFNYNLIRSKTSVKFKKLYNDAQIPKYAHFGDMGADLYAYSLKYDKEKDLYIYGTGIAFESCENIGALGLVRSSFKEKDFILTNHVGVLDTNIYRGEIMYVFRPRIDAKTYIKNKAFDAWVKLPWYKKLKKNSFDIIHKRIENDFYFYEEYLDRAPFFIGEKMGQLVFIHYPTVDLIETDTLSDSVRGTNGFGSTGK